MRGEAAITHYFDTSTETDPQGGAAISCSITDTDGTVTTAPDVLSNPFWSVPFGSADLAIGTHAVACFVRAAADGSYNASLDARLHFQVLRYSVCVRDFWT